MIKHTPRNFELTTTAEVKAFGVPEAKVGDRIEFGFDMTEKEFTKWLFKRND